LRYDTHLCDKSYQESTNQRSANVPRYKVNNMSEKFFERRPDPAQFPPKHSTLPGIGGSVPSSPMPGNQLVPYQKGFDVESEKYRQLETRINISERSNRALLEEVVRLQSELKGSIRRNEEIVRQEQLNRQQMENSLRSSNELIMQLSVRLKRTEEKLQDEKSALSSLMNQQKTVEQVVLGSQQELMSRKDLQTTKIDELRSELNEVTRVKDNLERVTFQLADEMRQIKTKLDTQTVDLVSTVNELKHRSKRLEDDNRQLNEVQNIGEQTTYQLRTQVESRLAELRDVVVDIRGKHDLEVQERRTLEQQIQARLSDLQSNIREQSRKSDEAINAMDAMNREREHNSEKEKIQLQSKIAEIAEEVGKKILQRELKLREDTRQKFSQLEQALTYEQEARQKFEKENREESEQRWESLKKLSDDELEQLKEQIKNEKKKTTETLHNLNKAVNLIEKQMEEHKKQQDKLLSAEIKSRKQTEKETTNKIDHLEDKLRVGMNTLQDALGSTAGQITIQGEKLARAMEQIKELSNENAIKPEQLDKIRNELKEEIDDVKRAETRHITDLDARLVALNNKITQSEDTLESKINTNDSRSFLTERVIEFGCYYLFILGEEASRTAHSGVAELKEELERRIPGTPKEPSNKDIEACQSSIRKLAESIQTVKTVLGMKIQSEQKLVSNSQCNFYTASLLYHKRH
ncbi:hypothetical protein LSH36_34g07043, partial [Paralvinella palmiformis]